LIEEEDENLRKKGTKEMNCLPNHTNGTIHDWRVRLNPYAPCINPEMVSVSCTSKPLDVFNGFLQVKKTKDLEPLSSFSFGPTKLEEEERNGFCELYSKTIRCN